jgi:protein O-mannosyl-transferase
MTEDPEAKPIHSMRVLVLIVIVTLLTYAGVVDLGFVSDDHGLITHPQAGIGSQTLSAIFTGDLWHFQQSQSGYYRPLMMLSLMADHSLFGLEAWGYHLHSLLWHLGAVVLLSHLFGHLFGNERGLIVAGIYAVHPLVAEQVCFISARNDSMALSLGLGALLMVLPRHATRARCLAATALAAAACLSKETAIVVLCLLPMFDWARHRALLGWHRYAALVAGITTAFFVREVIGPGLLHAPQMHGATVFQSERLSIMATLLGKLVWPLPLTDSLHIAYLNNLPLPAVFGGAFLMVFLWVVGGRWSRVGLTFTWLSLIPGLLATASRFVIGERYLTLPLLGLAIAIAGAAPRHRRIPVWLLLLVPWAIASHDRVADWRTDLSLAKAAYSVTATPYTAAWLGHELKREDRIDEAAPYYDEATSGNPPTCDFAGEWISATRQHAGASRALAVASIVWDRGCASGPGVRGAWAEAHIAAGDIDGARQILTPRPARCDATLAVAMVSLALIDGNTADAKRCAQSSRMPPDIIGPRVQALVAALKASTPVPEPEPRP